MDEFFWGIFKPRSYKIKNGKWIIFDGLCKGCFLCVSVCPLGGIEIDKNHLGVYSTPSVKVNPKKCQGCRACEKICPEVAIKIDTDK